LVVAPLSTRTRIAAARGTPVPEPHWFDVRKNRTPTMRWKISHRGHDVRQIDLLALLALLIAIIVAWHYFGGVPLPRNTAAFIEPSQSVRW
jgi:hypothetical protein